MSDENIKISDKVIFTSYEYPEYPEVDFKPEDLAKVADQFEINKEE